MKQQLDIDLSAGRVTITPTSDGRMMVSASSPTRSTTVWTRGVSIVGGRLVCEAAAADDADLIEVWMAPMGTSLPTDHRTPLDEAFRSVGFADESWHDGGSDGFTVVCPAETMSTLDTKSHASWVIEYPTSRLVVPDGSVRHGRSEVGCWVLTVAPWPDHSGVLALRFEDADDSATSKG